LHGEKKKRKTPIDDPSADTKSLEDLNRVEKKKTSRIPKKEKQSKDRTNPKRR